MCPPDYYVSGMDAKVEETPTKYALIDFEAELAFSSIFNNDRKHPYLNKNGEWHAGNCWNPLSSASKTASIFFEMPTNDV